jgi:hypothetical protein
MRSQQATTLEIFSELLEGNQTLDRMDQVTILCRLREASSQGGSARMPTSNEGGIETGRSIIVE